jgi:hypothetical protein
MAQVLYPFASTALTLILAIGIGLSVAYMFGQWLNKL